MREFLLYVSDDAGRYLGDFLAPCREWDLAVNNFRGLPFDARGAEYAFQTPGHKWHNIDADIAEIAPRYRACAFLDDDIEISGHALNRLFHTGLAFDLDVWQPSLTDRSYVGWPHTRQVIGGVFRFVPFVEIMAPFFTRAALARCWPTFRENYSGWGIDFLWPLRFPNPRFAVIFTSATLVSTAASSFASSAWIAARATLYSFSASTLSTSR